MEDLYPKEGQMVVMPCGLRFVQYPEGVVVLGKNPPYLHSALIEFQDGHNIHYLPVFGPVATSDEEAISAARGRKP